MAWKRNLYYSDLMGNITGSPPTWPDADYGMRSQIETDVTQVLQQLPKTVPVALNFTANWYMRGIISSPDAGLEYYNMGFDRAASVSMVVENGTALTAAGSFYVQTSDGGSDPDHITVPSPSLQLSTQRLRSPSRSQSFLWSCLDGNWRKRCVLSGCKSKAAALVT